MPFYREIAGMLLFLFFILFGVQQNMKSALDFHYNVIVTIVQTGKAMIIFSMVMAAYTLKCISFINSETAKRSHQFLRILNAVSYRKRFYHSFIAGISMMAPAIIYSIIVIFIALTLHDPQKALIVAAVISLLCISVSLFLIYSLQKENSVISKKYFWQHLIVLPKNITWFLGNQLFKKQLRAFVIVKLLSFLSLFYFIRHDDSVFEERMLWLIFMVSMVAHGIIIHKSFSFLENELSFYRAMPLSNWKILSALLLFYILLCVPEFWALRGLALTHGNWYSYLCMITGAPLILLFLHCLLYTDDMAIDSFLPLLSGVALVLFFFSFSDNKWLIPAITLFGSFIVFHTSFRTYERLHNKSI